MFDRMLFAGTVTLAILGHLGAQETDDSWTYHREEQSNVQTQTRKLLVHARAESKPALKHRLVADEFEMEDGNSLVYYVKAAGFIEQNSARVALQKVWDEAIATAPGGDISNVPPFVWLATPPNQLPIDDVREHLQLTSFQPPLLREAARKRDFDASRNYKQADDPIAILLPEIQVMRELARNQSLRCRLAIAEDRVDDAIEIIGQQFAMARQLGQDDFLVSNLVGIAVAGIAWNDALYLVQHPDTPNLYWALAAMPDPLVSMDRSLANERVFLQQQVKVLREVGLERRPAGYWQVFIDRLLDQIGSLAYELPIPSIEDDRMAARAAVVGYVAAAYPGAKQFLIEHQKLPVELVESYPTAQVVFLAVDRFHQHWRDELFKWMYLPVAEARTKSASGQVEQAMRRDAERYGFCAMPTMLFLPAIQAAHTASARSQQVLSLLRTVEALRLHAAEHQGALPESLDDLSVPAPIEPFTGDPIRYEKQGDQAILTGHELPGLQYRLIVQIAD